jgi:transcriptional regulator with XRE-family HTH domain
MIGRLRAVRKKLGINQGEFARRMGLTQAALSTIEVGKTKLTEKNIKLICVTFNVSEQWLRTGEGEMFGSLSRYETELLELYRQLSEETQEFILDMTRTLLKRHKEKLKEREGENA